MTTSRFLTLTVYYGVISRPFVESYWYILWGVKDEIYATNKNSIYIHLIRSIRRRNGKGGGEMAKEVGNAQTVNVYSDPNPRRDEPLRAVCAKLSWKLHSLKTPECCFSLIIELLDYTLHLPIHKKVLDKRLVAHSLGMIRGDVTPSEEMFEFFSQSY